jgi:hypothetical protein
MGYYIQTPKHQNKAEQIARLYGGTVVSKPDFSKVPFDKAVIVVVSNGPFDAASYAFNQSEFDAFHEPGDYRLKKYVLMDKTQAEILSGYRR